MDDEIKMELEELKPVKTKLMSWLKSMCECSPSDIDLSELEKLTDAVKDIAETKEKCLEGAYYKTVVEAMENGDTSFDEDERFGYNSNRRSSGRYAPKGTGDMTMGYPMRYLPRVPDYDINDYMGYSISGQNGSNYSNTNRSSVNRSNSGGRYGYELDDFFDPRYGEAYNRYRIAKRHYTESNSDADRLEMDEHAVEHMNDLLSSAREIYKSSTPELRKKFMEDLNNMRTSLSSMS